MQEFIAFATELAGESGELILSHYGTSIEVMRKADASPVTIADQQAEALMRERILARFPEHQVLGEEAGLSGPEAARYRWVLDPIDGTKSFIHHVPLFGTLIALLDNGAPVLGAIHLPVLGELMIGAQGRPTTVNGQPCRVSSTAALDQAVFCYTDSGHLASVGYGEALSLMQQKVWLTRGWGDCYGHFQVAAGRVDLMFDPQLNVWDVAALKPCVEGAGGRLTDVDGEGSGLGESALSSNALLHDATLCLLNAKR